ncbi:MAG: response regulator [Cyclobacteriaceae bacterium]
MNLLIIDDDSICNFINTRVAQTAGIFKDIRSVHNGKEALDIFEEVNNGNGTAPDVVLLDLNMPLLHGFDFIQTLQDLAFPNKDRLSIIILTSSDNSIDIQRARSLGIEHYLMKPLTVNDLQTTIFALYDKAPEQSGNAKNL